jgi:hypothetical protein
MAMPAIFEKPIKEKEGFSIYVRKENAKNSVKKA